MVRSPITCKVHISDVKENLPVYFKWDGNRFECPLTLKMLQNSKFQFNIHYQALNVTPIQKIEVDGRRIQFEMSTSPCDQKSTVSFFWNSPPHQANSQGNRSLIRVLITFEDTYFFEFPLQVKYYENKKSHHLKWGQALNYLQIETCDDKTFFASRSSTLVSINCAAFFNFYFGQNSLLIKLF